MRCRPMMSSPKSHYLVLTILLFNDYILCQQNPPPQKKGEIDLQIGKYGLANRGRFPAAGGPLGNIVGTGRSITQRKGRMSGLAKALDNRLSQIDRFGNPYGGMPEDMLGHIRFCAEFIYSGLYTLVYTTIRYPLKILMKAVIMTGAIGHILSYANWCINPLQLLDFTDNGKKANAHLDRLAQFRDENKKRMMWVTDKAQHADIQMYTCCALHEYKRKVYEEVVEVQNFAKLYFVGLYKIPEIVYCWKYQMGSKACRKVDLSPTDEDPDRVVPASFLTPYVEMLDRFL